VNFREHLAQRGLTPEIHCWIDYKKELVTFPLYNGGLQLAGYQIYNWNERARRNNGGRYWTYISSSFKNNVVYGLGNLKNTPELFIVEGIWDAIRIIQCGYNAIATMCNNPNKQLVWWIKHFFTNKTRIVICDNDNAGKELGKCGNYSYSIESPYKDINQMPFNQAKIFLESLLREI